MERINSLLRYAGISRDSSTATSRQKIARRTSMPSSAARPRPPSASTGSLDASPAQHEDLYRNDDFCTELGQSAACSLVARRWLPGDLQVSDFWQQPSK